MAVGAPTPRDVDQHHFAVEARIGVADQAAVQVRKAEAKWLGEILHAGVARGIGGIGHSLGVRLFGSDRGQFALTVFQDVERAVACQAQLQQQRPNAGEMAEHKLAIAIGPRERARVAVDAQNGGGDVGAGLMDDEAPRQLSLWTVVGNGPQAGDGRRVLTGVLGFRAPGVKSVDGMFGAAGLRVCAFERSVFEGRFQSRGKVVPGEGQRAVVKMAGG